MNKSKEDNVKFCPVHKVWYIDGEQPCKACLFDAKEKANAEK